MDIISLISDQVTPVSLAIVIMWFYNKLVIDFLGERKEMIDSLRAERKEWIAQSDRNLAQMFETNNKYSESFVTVKNEIHTLHVKINDLVLLHTHKGSPKDE